MRAPSFLAALTVVLAVGVAGAQNAQSGDVLLLTASSSNGAAVFGTNSCGGGSAVLTGLLPSDTITITATLIPAIPLTAPLPFLLVAGAPHCGPYVGPPVRVKLSGPTPAVFSDFFFPDELVKTYVVPAGYLTSGLPTSPPVPSPMLQAALLSPCVPGAVVLSNGLRLDMANIVGASSALSGAAFLAGVQVVPAPSHVNLINEGALEIHPAGGDLLHLFIVKGDALAGFDIQFTQGANSFTVAAAPSQIVDFGSGNIFIQGISIPSFFAGQGLIGNQVAVSATNGPSPVALTQQLIPVTLQPVVATLNDSAVPSLTLGDFAAPRDFVAVFANQAVSIGGVGYFDEAEINGGALAGLCGGSDCETAVEFTSPFAACFGPAPGNACDGTGAARTPPARTVTPTLIELGSPQSWPNGAPGPDEFRPIYGATGIRLVNTTETGGTTPADTDPSAAFPRLLIQNPIPPLAAALYPRVVAAKTTAAAATIRLYGQGFFRRNADSSASQPFVGPLLSDVAVHTLYVPIVTFGPDGTLRVAPRVTFVSSNELEVTVPPDLAIGTYDVRVYNPDGRESRLVGALNIVPPLTKGDDATGLTLFGVPLPDVLDKDWFQTVLAVQAAAAPSMIDATEKGSLSSLVDSYPPVVVVRNPRRLSTQTVGTPSRLGDPDRDRVVQGLVAPAPPATTSLLPPLVDHDQGYDYVFLFNTRNPDGSMRIFDFDSVDIPDVIIPSVTTFHYPRLSHAAHGSVFNDTGTGIASFGGTAEGGAPPLELRVLIKAAAFKIETSSPGASEPLSDRIVRFFAEENYALVLRSRGNFFHNGVIDVSGASLVPQLPPPNEIQGRGRWTIDLCPVPAGGGIGGRGGAYYSRNGGNSAWGDLEMDPVDDSLVFPRTLAPFTPAFVFTPTPSLINGRAGQAPLIRQALLGGSSEPAPSDLHTSASSGFLLDQLAYRTAGGGAFGQSVVGGTMPGGGGGGHAETRVFEDGLFVLHTSTVGQTGSGLGGTAGSPFSNGYDSALLPAPAPADLQNWLPRPMSVFDGLPVVDGRLLFVDDVTNGGYDFANMASGAPIAGAVLGGSFPYRAASRFDFGATTPAPDLIGAAPERVVGDDIPGEHVFPATLFAGGSGGGGGGGSSAIFVPSLTMGGRGGNGGGCVVVVCDGIFSNDLMGRIYADGEDGHGGISTFPVPGAPVLPLTYPGNGGGGAGGMIAVFAISDVFFDLVPTNGSAMFDAAADRLPPGVAALSAGRGLGSTGITSATKDGGNGGAGRIRISAHRLAVFGNPGSLTAPLTRPSGLPDALLTTYALNEATGDVIRQDNWFAEFENRANKGELAPNSGQQFRTGQATEAAPALFPFGFNAASFTGTGTFGAVVSTFQ